MSKNFTSHVLDNGLTVHLMENHSAPIISHWIWYRVGSRNEVPGKTGLSHFVEHMLFKGTRCHPGLEAVLEIARSGGTWGGYTLYDHTSYLTVIPAHKIGTAIDIEADRMVNSLFDPQEIESERTVILSEKAGNESHSSYRLMQSMLRTAFPHHPYGRDVIGEMEDIYAITRDDLYQHYRSWYAPNNAVVTLAGDFETEEMLRMIEKAYGRIPVQAVPKLSVLPDEPFRGPFCFEEPGIVNDLEMGWRIPDARDPDIPALILLDGILSGAGLEGALGRNTLPNNSSRLGGKLVRAGIISDIIGFYVPTLDPYIYRLAVSIDSDMDVKEAAEAILAEIESIARQGLRPAEIEKARKQAKALFTYSAEDPIDQAYWLGYSSIFADPSWYIDYPRRLENVKAEDISRVAGTLLSRENSITGMTVIKEVQP